MASAEKRVLTVNLYRKLYPAEVAVNNINYLGGSIQLSVDDIDNLVNIIPNFWNSDKDCLIKFVYYDDGTYMCQREKEVYNYSLRETEKKVYFFDSATQEQVNNLVILFAEYYGNAKISKIEHIYDSILNTVSDFSYVKFYLLKTRQKLLQESDYKMMSDYPLDEEEKDKWSTYRQELRDITKQEGWIANDFVNVIVPVSPQPQDQLVELFKELENLVSEQIPPNILNNFKNELVNIGVENVINKFSELTLKLEIISGLSNLGLPFIVSNGESVSVDKIFPYKIEDILPEYNEEEVSTPTKNILTRWQKYLVDVDKKIDEINKNLKSYNIDFTIGDIVAEVSEHTKKKLDEIQKTEEAEKLIQDLQIQNTYEKLETYIEEIGDNSKNMEDQ
jgi:hypothetical protein